MRFIKWTLGALVLVAVLLVALLFLIPSEKIAGIAAARFEAETGRALTIDGPVRPSLWPVLGLSAETIEIANADWSDEPVMLRAEALRVSVDAASILTGSPRITGVTLVRPDLVLEKSADGQANWELLAAEGEETVSPVEGEGPAFTLDRAAISDGRLIYRDLSGGQSYELSDLSVETTLADLSAPMPVTVSAQMGGEVLAAEMTLAEPSELMAGRATGLRLAATLGKAQLDFDGMLDPEGEMLLVGKTQANLPDTGATLAAIGYPGIDLPEGFGRALRLSAEASYGADRLTARDLALNIDQNALAGEASLDLSGDVPFLTAGLSAGDLDFSALAGDETEDETGATGWSKEPITLEGLDALDADVTLAANSIDLGTVQFERSRIAASLREGTLTTRLTEVQAYQGAMTGTLTLTGGQSLSLRGDIAAKSVTLQSFMRDFFDFEKITGTGDIDMTFAARGGSIDALMHGLNGKGRINFGKGELLGFDLVGMLRNLDGSFVGAGAKTIFNSITASFDIVNGVVNNVDLILLAPLAEATGEGTVGIGEQTINYRVTPRLLKGEAAEGGISVPVLITGSWSDLKFRPDLEALINQNEAVKAATEELKQKADEAVGKAKEDATKKVEDEIKKGLGKLLGGN